MPFADIRDEKRLLKNYLKVNHRMYDNHVPYDPFKLKGATLDSTNIKQKKSFNFLAGDEGYHIDWLKNPYKPEKSIAYFQPTVYRSIGIREDRGKTLNYNTMIQKNGWNL